MGLPKAFCCIPSDLLLVNLKACGFDQNILVLIYSYLRGRNSLLDLIARIDLSDTLSFFSSYTTITYRDKTTKLQKKLYLKNYENTTGTIPWGAKDNGYPMANKFITTRIH